MLRSPPDRRPAWADLRPSTCLPTSPSPRLLVSPNNSNNNNHNVPGVDLGEFASSIFFPCCSCSSSSSFLSCSSLSPPPPGDSDPFVSASSVPASPQEFPRRQITTECSSPEIFCIFGAQ
ncbi:uncharacterized protein BO88DRAFT_53213 [Aspergillus vadensis CBS 113365]|uniref:Uncharacterized protein n=1 Tax=Aspergillus vadensis (strain CBS 113365 / IMI 142717 / IBT 24658) TaxID=1448311 RepID=A0A319B813_ASPVC|nr:hypothetical protein BO88DRAFT_53213 [Aspergillus vadensis CBS 113365]PYH68857.1 hypothetical protein BO88DRAFT_53213 [Aspergillus vadensis CBS 113365]